MLKCHLLNRLPGQHSVLRLGVQKIYKGFVIFCTHALPIQNTDIFCKG